MLSVIFAESGDNLAHLIDFYAPQATEILDVTYGNGTLCSRLRIPVVGVDIDPDTKAQIIADATGPLPLEQGRFSVVVYDPPYLYGAHAMHMGPIGAKTWKPERSTWKKPEELFKLSEGIARNLLNYTAQDCTIIVKIMDSRYKGRLCRNHNSVTVAFEEHGWYLHDQLVYIRTVTGSFVNKRSAQSTHGYFLIL